LAAAKALDVIVGAGTGDGLNSNRRKNEKINALRTNVPVAFVALSSICVLQTYCLDMMLTLQLET
jgi:hypothetical protein